MKTILSITLILFGVGAFGQNTAYMESGKKRSVLKKEEKLVLTPSGIMMPQTLIAMPDLLDEISEAEFFNKRMEKLSSPTVFLEVAKQIFAVSYNMSISGLEGRIKKFSSEYEREMTYLEVGSRSIPNITYQQSLQLKRDVDYSNGLTVELDAHKVEGINYFYYSVKSIKLGVSRAKTMKKSAHLDYSIVVQTTFLIDTTVKTITSAPIQINSVAFGSNDFDKQAYPSDLIPIPKDAFFLKAGIKIIETNPKKVDAQRLLDFWKKTKEENSDSIEKLIKAILGEEEDRETK